MEPVADLMIPGTRQAVVLVGMEVRARFTEYQRDCARRGAAPTNVKLLFEALNDCYGRYREIVAARQQTAAQPGSPFGGTHVPGRRVSAEARPTAQLPFRPTHHELSELKQQAAIAGAPSMSALVDAVLDAWLPPLRKSARGAAGAPVQPSDGVTPRQADR